MLTLISPAKKLLNNIKPYHKKTTNPLLINEAVQLATIMKSKSVDQIAGLMDLSLNLAELNFNRYQQFNLKDCPVTQSYPALFLFQGDVYQGLSASSWKEEDIVYSQDHLGILSGLYGLLKPLDRIQPYRLEMGVRLASPCGDTLYDFWRDTVTKNLNQQLTLQDNPILINLASTEYFKVINLKKLKFPVVTINFYEQKNNEIKMISIFAKKARGLMARFIMQNKIDDLEQIKKFCELGYCYNEEASTEHCFHFIRAH